MAVSVAGGAGGALPPRATRACAGGACLSRRRRGRCRRGCPPALAPAPGAARSRRSRWRRRSRRAGRRRRCAANTVVSTSPPASTQRAARVAGAHEAAQRRQQPRHGPLAVGVLGAARPACARSAPAARRRGRSRGSRGSRRRRPTAGSRRARAPAARVRARASTAMSFVGSNAIGSRGRPGELPPISTVVSCSPATTWALVTTTSGAATQPGALDRQPAGGAEHAHDAARGAPAPRRCARSRLRARRRPATGPVIDGSGSSRASAFRIGPDGGSTWLSSRRIAERWMSARSAVCPGVWPATAARIHTMPRPSAAPSSAPSIPSSSPMPGDDQAFAAA